jgi:DNA-binding HxlR family transcriptional regulator
MTPITKENEALVLRHLQKAHPVILDQLVEDTPELSWNQIFQTVDALSRQGIISLRRRGFEYEVSTIPQYATG